VTGVRDPAGPSGRGDRTRVVVVDDQTLVRQGIRTLLDMAGIEVVGEADDGEAALAAIDATRPDVVLLDLRMPRRDGIWVLRRLRERGADVPVLVLTTFDDDTLVLDALRAGARGYLLKDVTLEQLTRAVETLAAGGTLIAVSITDRLLRAIRSAPSPVGVSAPPAQELTERELDVLRLVAEGYTNREIAGLLFLAEGTVKNHVSAILLKLGARDRTNAVLRALHEGVLR
jgi:DNA-binding NarL/FixJ family response regulator